MTSSPFPLTDNLMLTADHKTVKLADFGLAREDSLNEMNMMTAETWTYRWMPPEFLGIFCSASGCVVLFFIRLSI